MTTYLIQVNVALVLFYLGYRLCLARETNFALQRSYLLFALFVSVIAPLINFRVVIAMFAAIPAEPAFEATWLPEVTVQAIQTVEPDEHWLIMWISILYWIGFAGALFILLVNFVRVKQLFAKAIPKRDKTGWYYILEDSPISFSFLRYVFLGNAALRTEEEKQTILTHERAHARLGHSFDVLFVRLLGVLVWFNPVIYWIKREMEVVHEFQADASTIQTESSNAYCQLLVRETLAGQHISFANHFNKSLTLKRIQMIRSIKKTMSRSRLVGLGMFMLLVFVIFSCEEKVMADLKNAPKQSLELKEYPESVKKAVNQIKRHDSKSSVKVYGLVNADDMKNFINENQPVTFVTEKNDPNFIGYLITGYQYDVVKWNSEIVDGNRVFTTVEDITQPKGGMAVFYKQLAAELRYPAEALKKNISGRVFVKFMVDEAGALSNFEIVQGIGHGCDEEAIRALKKMPNWEPSTFQHIPVKSYYNLAVAFDPEMGK